MTEIKDVLADRDGKYGKFADVADLAQDLKTSIRDGRVFRGELRAGDGRKVIRADMVEALDMICSKIARIVNGDPTYVDNWIDIAGYATLVANRLEGKTSAPVRDAGFVEQVFRAKPGDPIHGTQGWELVRKLPTDGDYERYLFRRPMEGKT